jgi:hypothetical protein
LLSELSYTTATRKIYSARPERIFVLLVTAKKGCAAVKHIRVLSIGWVTVWGLGARTGLDSGLGVEAFFLKAALQRGKIFART